MFLDSDDTFASEPRFSSARNETGALTISHREYITDIYGNPTGTPFVNQGFSINPGLEATFPWLSQVAQNFEEYSIKQLVFTYKSTIQDVNSANGQVGSVVTATNYNPSRGLFENKMVMMEYAHAHTTKAVDTNIHGVEADPAKNSGPEGKYVRQGSVPSGEDIKTYDLGKFQIAVCGTPAVLDGLPIGELWVNYTVELRKPKLFTGLGLGISSFRVRNSQISSTSSHNDEGAYPLGKTSNGTNYPVYNTTNSLACTVNTDSGTTITLPDNFAGTIELNIHVVVNAGFSSGQYDWYRIQPPALLGNITEHEDMIAGASQEEGGGEPSDLDAPTHFFANASMAAINDAHLGLMLKAHFKVQPATGGVKNEFTWGTTGNNAYDDARGDVMVWVNTSSSLQDWSAIGGTPGTSWTSTSGGYINSCELQLTEYAPAIQDGKTIPVYKTLDGVTVLA